MLVCKLLNLNKDLGMIRYMEVFNFYKLYFTYFQCRYMWKEVIVNKEIQKYKIIN